MSLVWINLHHLEAGGSILIAEAAMIQWPLTPRVTGNKCSQLRVLRALITYLRHSLVILMVYSWRLLWWCNAPGDPWHHYPCLRVHQARLAPLWCHVKIVMSFPPPRIPRPVSITANCHFQHCCCWTLTGSALDNPGICQWYQHTMHHSVLYSPLHSSHPASA